MQDDEVTQVVRNDILILTSGEKLLKVGKEQHNRHFISQKMRELGRFVLKVQEIEKEELSLEDTIYASRFLKNVNAVKYLAGFDEDNQTYRIPT